MKTDRNTLHEMERLYQLWEAEVTSAQEQGRADRKNSQDLSAPLVKLSAVVQREFEPGSRKR